MMWGGMFARRPTLSAELERPEVRDAWIAWGRAAAVPLVFLEVAVEHGNYPPGSEAFAWALASALAIGAPVFLLLPRWRAAALVFDWTVVSCFVAVYSFEPGTPVRQLLFLPVVEAALRYGIWGGLLTSLASAPALAFFEWRQAVRLDLHPFDAGHIAGPVGIQLLVGLALGAVLKRAGRHEPLSSPAGGKPTKKRTPRRGSTG
jgi:hypothetical protein